jgi:CDP-diacylglycerol---glycerol-3-phosphate 3-phosphatidyltransferase
MTPPNQLTVLRIFLTPIFVFLLVMGGMRSTQAATIVFIIASLTDWYDGHVARKYGYVSKWGKFLDPIADKVLISSALLAFLVLKYVQLWMVIVIIARDVMITGLRSYALLINSSVQTSNLAKWKTASQMALVFLLLLVVNLERGGIVENGQMINWNHINFSEIIEKATLFVTVFTALTGVYYLIENRQLIKYLARRFYRVFIPSDL